MAVASLRPTRRYEVTIYGPAGRESAPLHSDRYLATSDDEAWEIATTQYATSPGWYVEVARYHTTGLRGYQSIRMEQLPRSVDAARYENFESSYRPLSYGGWPVDEDGEVL